MIECIGDIFSVPSSEKILCTCNSVLKKNGGLVMGAGFARECMFREPGIDQKLGRLLEKIGVPTPEGIYYGIMLQPVGIGAIQTKYDWRHPTPISLLRKSINALQIMSSNLPNTIFNLPRPGCMNGGLDWDQVRPICEYLPDNVVVWSRD